MDFLLEEIDANTSFNATSIDLLEGIEFAFGCTEQPLPTIIGRIVHWSRRLLRLDGGQSLANELLVFLLRPRIVFRGCRAAGTLPLWSKRRPPTARCFWSNAYAQAIEVKARLPWRACRKAISSSCGLAEIRKQWMHPWLLHKVSYERYLLQDGYAWLTYTSRSY